MYMVIVSKQAHDGNQRVITKVWCMCANLVCWFLMILMNPKLFEIKNRNQTNRPEPYN